MTIAEIKKDAERRMHNSVEALRVEFKHLRSGRASIGLLEGVTVDYYGTPTPLNQVANLQAPDATLLLVSPWELTMCPAIEKAIRTSDLGLNPSSDGKVVRVPIPAPTEERRKELAKKAHQLSEKCKVEIREHRHKANDQIKKEAKASAVSADEEKRSHDEVQKMTDKAIADIEALLKTKETEIMAR